MSTDNGTNSFVLPEAVLFTLQYVVPYLLLILIPIGILGNLASLWIFLKKRKTDRVSTQYLSVLAVFDLILISYVGVPLWLFVNLDTVSFGYLAYERQAPNDTFCKITNYTYNVCVFMSGWILITFSFERLLVIWQPLKMAPIVSSGKPRKIALVSLFLFALVECSGHLFWTRLIPTVDGSPLPAKCKFEPEIYSAPVFVVWYNISCFCLANGLPLVLISLLNILILIVLKRNKMTEGKTTSTSDTKAVMNLMLVCLFFVIFVTPFETMYFMQTYFETAGKLHVAMSPGFVQLWLTADTFHYFNYCCNPFIYTWSLDFYRKEVVKLLSCCRKGGKRDDGLDASRSTVSTK